MEKNNKNISINLQISKNIHDGKLSLNVVFDKNAENFCMENDVVSWSPTFEEIDFIVEAFSVLSNKKNAELTESAPVELDVSEPKVSETDSTFEDEKQNIPKEVAFEPEFTDDEEKDSSTSLKEAKVPPKMGNQIFVPASSQAIDDALKRKKEEEIDDDFIVEASEKAILDKVLKHKKKKL